MFDRFADSASKALSGAVESATEWNHPFVGSEHLLLALSRQDGVGRESLAALGVSHQALRERVADAAEPLAKAPDGAPPFTRTTKRILELSLREALLLQEDRVAAEHIMLGLARCEDSGAAELLDEQGVSRENVRHTVLARLRSNERQQERAASGESGRKQPMRGPPTAGGDNRRGRREVRPQEVEGDPHPGMRVGGYRLVGEALATSAWPGKPWVWRASYEPADNEEQVLKLYLLSDLDQGQRERLELEAEMGKRWSRYREVVHTIFSGEIGPYYVIAMLPMGPTLEEHIEQRRQDPSQWRSDKVYARWIHAIGAVLSLIHNAGELHRDITTRNILLERDERDVRLSDFSIAIDETVERHTAVGEFIGTQGEVAPEHYRGQYSPASDQYQLALVSWHLLADAPYPEDPERRLHPNVRAVLEHALSPEPTRRHGNVLAFVTQLSAAIEAPGRPTLALLAHAPPAACRFIGRMVLLLLLAAGLSAWSGREAYPQGSTQEALSATLLGIGFFVVVLLLETVSNVMRGNTARSDPRGWLAGAARVGLPPFAGAIVGLALVESTDRGAVPDLLRWLVPWLCASPPVLIQTLAGKSPSVDEAQGLITLTQVLGGARGRRAALFTFLLILVGVLGGSALAVIYIRGG